MSDDLYAVILAGGSGTRFWPKSRHKTPKQLTTVGDNSATMLEVTLRRLDGVVPPDRRLIVTHKDQAAKTQAIAGARCPWVLAEPEARNTANALALAALDLQDDSVKRLTSPDSGLSPAGKNQNLWLSLAGVGSVDKGVIVYVYVAPRNDGPLDPAFFFAPHNLWAIPLFSNVKPRVDPGIVSPIEQPLTLGSHVHGTGGLKIQKAWMSLTLAGDMEKVLLDWHTYSERETDGPLFPYCLWLLSSLYGESFALMALRDGRDAEVLRTFGTEVARALLNYRLAPSYIRGLALHSYETLMEGRPLPYRFAQLTASDKPAGSLPAN